jgi:succinate dehydrogenase / fumarate reductase cytochrome b subunit
MHSKTPISPHLQIYKPQITSVLSILHRISGFFLFLGSFIWSGWLIGLASGPECYVWVQDMALHPLGLIVLVGWSFVLFYHILNGIRHLMWDAGIGVDINTATKTGWVVIFGTMSLTILTWIQAILWGVLWS